MNNTGSDGGAICGEDIEFNMDNTILMYNYAYSFKDNGEGNGGALKLSLNQGDNSILRSVISYNRASLNGKENTK